MGAGWERHAMCESAFRVKQSAYQLFPLELLFRMFINFRKLRAELYDIRVTLKQNAQVISSFQIFRPSIVCGSHFLYVEQMIRPSNSSGFDPFKIPSVKSASYGRPQYVTV